MPSVRRFLIDHGVSWPNVLNGTGENDYAKAFGVEEIPANFLIGRDGKIIGFELGETSMDQAIGEALGGEEEVQVIRSATALEDHAQLAPPLNVRGGPFLAFRMVNGR